MTVRGNQSIALVLNRSWRDSKHAFLEEQLIVLSSLFPLSEDLLDDVRLFIVPETGSSNYYLFSHIKGATLQGRS